MFIAATLSPRPTLARATHAYRPLGAFRLLLAVMVMVRHFQRLLSPPEPAWLQHAGLGMVAVAIFFVVSGFVVVEACMVFYAARPAAFFANRLLRLVPPYLAALSLAVIVQSTLWQAGLLRLWDYSLTNSPLQPRLLAAGVLSLIPGFHSAFVGAPDFEFLPFVWTLRVEITFYVAACLTLLATRKFRTERVTEAALLLGLLACGLFLCLGRPGLLSSGPMFLFGVALCLLIHRRDAPRVAFACTALALIWAGFSSYIQRGTPSVHLQLVLTALLLAALVWLIRLPACSWPRHLDKALGNLSYPLYLNHYAVGIAVYDTIPLRGAGVFLFALLLALAVSWLMSRAVDVPLIALRARLRGTAL
jgi:peptidoglycan/LPS O-acetylase OafA/YrhL